MRKNKIDLNHDNTITDTELAQAEEISQIEQNQTKSQTQTHLAWIAMISMVLFTALLFTPWISESRLNSLGDILDVFYIAQAGIVGSYFGMTAWISRKNSSGESNY